MSRGLAAGAAAALLAAASIGRAAETGGPPSVPRLGTCGNGSGGFLLPGTDACLTVGGFVRAEGSWKVAPLRPALAPLVAGAGRVPPVPDESLGGSAFGTEARLAADLRLPTELGPVRVFVSLHGHNGTATDRTAR